MSVREASGDDTSPSPGGDGGRLRVLFVEADDSDAFYARAVLQARGGEAAFVIDQVSQLGEARARLAGGRYDVALVDLALPDASGPGALQSLRNAHPRLPIVVLLSADQGGLGVQLVRLGADDVLRKGDLSGPALANTLELAVERRRSMLEPLSNLAEAVVVLADSGEVRMANRAAETLFERAESELIGEPLPVELPAGDATDITIPATDGDRVCEVQRRSIRWHDQPAEMVTLRDVTDRRAAADLRRRLAHADKLASIGQMAAGVAHEINNPAMAIKANLELLGDSDLSEEDHDLVDSCEAAVGRIHRIVTALGAFSRMEQEQIGAVNMTEVVELASRLTGNELRHRARLALRMERLPPVRGDRDRLTQVVINLLVNAGHAIDETAGGEQRIDVEGMLDGDTVVVRIRDTGCGIPERDLGRIFEPFYTTKRAGLGTGLGLSLVSDIMRQHGGEIRVSSEVGVGTVMELRLPRMHAPARPRVADDEDRPTPAYARRLRVLLIDDDDLVRRSCARLLKSRHEVVDLTSAEEALELLAEDASFDVVLSDIMMPGLDGPGLFEQARELYPHLAQRFGFFTGGAFTPRSRQFVERDDVVVVPKPITKPALLASIEEIDRRGREGG